MLSGCALRRALPVTVLAVLLLIVATGCKPKPAAGPSGGFAVQVVAVEAKRQPVTQTLSLIGSLAANEMVEMKSEAEGTVARIHFEEGQRVEANQLLIQLDETKWTASVAEAEARLKLSQSNFERAKQLLRDNLVSQQEFDKISSEFQVEVATVDRKRREWKDARIVAPFGGIVGARQISPGQVISRNSTLTWLVDLDPVKVEFNVPERFLSQAQVGQTIELLVAAFPGETFKGEVYFIAPQVDPAMRTVLVKARIKNPDFKLKPGMFANLELTLKVRDQAVVIPEAALMANGERMSVFIIDRENNAQVRPIKTGVNLPGEVEVVQGLSGGELVIVEGHQKTRPGGKVALAPPEAALPYQRRFASTNAATGKHVL